MDEEEGRVRGSSRDRPTPHYQSVLTRLYFSIFITAIILYFTFSVFSR